MNYLAQCDPADGGCAKIYPADLETCPKCKASTSLIAIPAYIDPSIYIYDIETYPNIFTFAMLHPASDTRWLYEISSRKNDAQELIDALRTLSTSKAKMVGYNSLNFDYPVIHQILLTPAYNVNVGMIYSKAMSIITGQQQKMIWDNQRIIDQIDLFKINHYDNTAKSTSLKALEFAMRMDSIQDLPYPPGTVLTEPQMDELIHYNWHDVLATTLFYVRCLEQISFRKELSEKYGMNFTNMSDSKIGSEIFIKKLNDSGVDTYTWETGKKQPRQSIRDSVALSECIPGYIEFERPEFQEILARFKSTVLYGTNVKALFKDFYTEIDGLEYVFGAGGQHACRSGYFESNDDYCILDLDVEAYYPSLIIAGNLTEGYYPEHLGEKFSPLFKNLITERIKVGKKTTMGQAYKLISNSQYGNMGNKYSPMFDLKCLLSTTLTGQLALSMLIEKMLLISGCSILYVNTDGFTVKILRNHLDYVKELITWWENLTHLKMEYNYYSRLWLNDTNNYIAEYEE